MGMVVEVRRGVLCFGENCMGKTAATMASRCSEGSEWKW